jgi:hypothetical protein
MKSKLLFVAAAAIIIVSYLSCNLFDSSSNNQSPLIGKWQIVNIADSSLDSSKNAMGLLLLGMASKDSLQIEFSKDSTFKIVSGANAVDSGKYVFDEKENHLSVFASDITQFSFKRSGDDSLQLFSLKDSLHYSLRKIK